MILKIAWRNIWRNRTRSLVLILSIVLGMCRFHHGLPTGGMGKQADDTIQQNLSRHSVPPSRLLRKILSEIYHCRWRSGGGDLQQDKEVKAYSERVVCMAMAASASKSTGVTLMVSYPNRRMHWTGLKENSLPAIISPARRTRSSWVTNSLENCTSMYARRSSAPSDEQGEIVSVALRVSGIFKDQEFQAGRGDDLHAAKPICLHCWERGMAFMR